jgi:capsular polysaccharide biosynthesis protein
VAIVEPPAAPALPEHSVPLYFLLAFGLAMVFSVGIAFTTEYFDPTIRTPGEAHVLLEVPVLAWLPAPKPVILRPSVSRMGRSKAVVQ